MTDWIDETFEGVDNVVRRRFPGERVGNFQNPITGKLKYAVYAVRHTGVRHPHIRQDFVDPTGASWR